MTTIQIIDDDIVLLTRLATQLEQEGYDVLKMSAAKPAVVMFEEHTPDLVVLEVKINGGEGWNLLRQFCADAPVLILSSNGREEDVVRGLESGAVDYVPKPYRTRELLARIRLRLNDSPSVNHTTRSVVRTDASFPVGQVSQNVRNDSSHTADVHHPVRVETEETTSSPPRSSQNDSIFISHVDEIELIRTHREPPVDAIADMSIPADTPLGRRLYMARRKRTISLVQAENDLRIRMSYLQAMEEEKFSLLPHGAMANHMLGAYAGYLGLDARKAIEDYQQFYAVRLDNAQTDTERSWSIFRNLPAVPKWLYWIVAFVLALVVSMSAIFWIDPDGVSALGTRLNKMIHATTPTPAPAIVGTTDIPEPTPPKPTLSPVIPVSPTVVHPLTVGTRTHTTQPALRPSPERVMPPDTRPSSPTRPQVSTPIQTPRRVDTEEVAPALPIATSTQFVLPTPSLPEATSEPQPEIVQPDEAPTSRVEPTELAQPADVIPTDTPVPPVPTDTPVPPVPTDTPANVPAQPVIPDEMPNTPVPPAEPPTEPDVPTEPSSAEPAAPPDEPPSSSDTDIAPETVPSISLDEPPTTPQGWTGN